MKDLVGRSRVRSAALALVLSLAAAGIASEAALRFLCTVCTWTEHNNGEYASPYQEPPDNSWYHLRAPSNVSSYGQPEFDFELRTNSLGIRDEEHPIPKPPGEFRIVGLGDSFTEGQGASYESSYLKVLERNLNAKQDDVAVRVIVGGVAGSDPIYCYRLLKDKLLPFAPDLVTLTINQSDIMDVVARGGTERFQPDGTVRFSEPPGDEWLFARSHLYRVLAMVLLGHDWFGLSASEHVVEREEAIETLKRVVEDFAELGRKAGFRFVVIFHPDSYELSTGRYEFAVDELKRHVSDTGIGYVDLMEYFTARTGTNRMQVEELYWKKDFHHNEVGYRIFAEGIEEYLTANRVIPLPLHE